MIKNERIRYLLFGMMAGILICVFILKTTSVVLDYTVKKYFSYEMISIMASYVDLKCLSEQKHKLLEQQLKRRLEKSLIRLAKSNYNPSKGDVIVLGKLKLFLSNNQIHFSEGNQQIIDSFLANIDSGEKNN